MTDRYWENRYEPTLLQKLAPNLRQYMGPTAQAFADQAMKYAPLGFAFRGPIMRGPAQGLRMEDFSKARAVDAKAEQIARDGIRLGLPRHDPGVTGGASYIDAPYSTEMLGDTARAYTPQPFRSPELPTDPYDAAVAIQSFARRAANR